MKHTPPMDLRQYLLLRATHPKRNYLPTKKLNYPYIFTGANVKFILAAMNAGRTSNGENSAPLSGELALKEAFMGIKVDRRDFLVATGAGAAAMSLSELRPAIAEPAAQPAKTLKPELVNVKACVFDTFGTVVDWRSSVIAQGREWGSAKGLKINWVEFTDKWRLGYKPIMDKVRHGQIPWTNLDGLHRMLLDQLLVDYKIELAEDEKVN